MKDALVLIQLLADHRCRYNTKVSANDYYVATKEELDLTDIPEHTRYHSALQNAETGCKVISFDELSKMLLVNEQAVKDAPWPKIKKIKGTGEIFYSSGMATSTIGDQLKAKGIDLQV